MKKGCEVLYDEEEYPSYLYRLPKRINQRVGLKGAFLITFLLFLGCFCLTIASSMVLNLISILRPNIESSDIDASRFILSSLMCVIACIYTFKKFIIDRLILKRHYIELLEDKIIISRIFKKYEYEWKDIKEVNHFSHCGSGGILEFIIEQSGEIKKHQIELYWFDRDIDTDRLGDTIEYNVYQAAGLINENENIEDELNDEDDENSDENIEKKRQDTIYVQFREALRSMVTSIKAGLSVNSAIIKCTEDLERLHSKSKNKIILNQFIRMRDDIKLGTSVDNALIAFGRRMNHEDINDFVYSIIIVREKGGNLVEVIENVSTIITDKMAIKRETQQLTAAKKMEANILSFLPIGMILMLSLISPDYMKPLLDTFIGKILIFICFILIVVNYFVGKKIVDIKV